MTLSKIALSISISFLVLISGCNQRETDLKQLDSFSQYQLSDWNTKLSDVIIQDIFSPPVSSRIYAYANIAAYEALVPGHPEYISLAGQLNGLSEVPKPKADKKYYYPLAGIIAFSTVSQKMVLSQAEINTYEKKYLEGIRETGLDDVLVQNSIEYGQEVAKHILDWMKKDGYIQMKALPRYVLSTDPGEWIPTPPDYTQAIEPHWGIVRTFALESASQFKLDPHTPFDSLPGSLFYKECMDVYKSNSTSGDTLDIAKHWDCNPNASYTMGHVMSFTQKLSPGGHWISIAAYATKSKNFSMMQSAETLALLSVSLADAFISCWNDKFKIKLIRPETYINRYIDPNWQPALQTPPFPEYPSGHSVISASASTVLTSLLGDSFAFVDSAEVQFGLPPRNFTSFYAAADEAAISRFYGGIHFMPAIINGVKHGREIGNYIAKNIKTRKATQAYVQ